MTIFKRGILPVIGALSAGILAGLSPAARAQTIVPVQGSLDGSTVPLLGSTALSIPTAGTVPSWSGGHTWYVTNASNPTGTGTSANPWNIATAFSSGSVANGDTILLGDGMYWDCNEISLGHKILVKPVNTSAHPWLLGAHDVSPSGSPWTWVSTQTEGGKESDIYYLPLAAQPAMCANEPPSYAQNDTYLSDSDPSAGDNMVFFHCGNGTLSGQYIPFSQIGGFSFKDKNGIVQNGTTYTPATVLAAATAAGLYYNWFWIDAADNRLYISTAHDFTSFGSMDPNTYDVAYTTKTQGPFVSTTGAASEVYGIGVAMYNWIGVGVAQPASPSSATAVTFLDDTICWNGVAGIDWGSSYGKIEACNISCNGDLGGAIGGGSPAATNITADGCTFGFNNTEGFNTTADASGCKFVANTDGTAQNCYFNGNFGGGVWFDVGSTDCNAVSNFVSGNTGAGIYYEISTGGTLAFNQVQSNGTGIGVSNSTDTDVYNNTLADNATLNLYFKYTIAGDSVSGNSAFNNIVSNDLTTGAVTSLLDAATGSTHGTSWASDIRESAGGNNNGYFRLKPSSLTYPSTLIAWATGTTTVTDYASLAGTSEFWSLGSQGTYGEYDQYSLDETATSTASNPFLWTAFTTKNLATNPAFAAGVPLPSNVSAALTAAQSSIYDNVTGQNLPSYMNPLYSTYSPYAKVDMGAYSINVAGPNDLLNPGFDLGGGSSTDWTLAGTGSSSIGTATVTQPPGAPSPDYFMSHWGTTASWWKGTTQTLTNIPNGIYELDVYVTSSGGESALNLQATGFASGGGGSASKVIPTTAINTWTLETLTVDVQDNQVTIGLYTTATSASQWADFDQCSFYLVASQ